MGKRIFDVVGATLGLLVVSPLLLIISLSVKLSSPGPVFFRQERIGRGFRPFRIIKFRTMWEGIPGPRLTARGDQRITPLGRRLRRTKMDELPQLWNVVMGEMSLVGPRPEIPEYVERFRDDYAEILKVCPGITDEASIVFRREELLLASTPDPETKYISEILPKKIAMAKDYVRSHSLLADFCIIVRTIAHV